VLSLMILYNNSVILLLRPLLNLESFQSSMVEETLWNHAQQGLFLLDEHYHHQYTCRYQPVMQMFAILHLSDTIARFFPGGIEGRSKDGPEAIQFALEILTESRVGFPNAGPLQEMLRRSAKECSIRIPIKQPESTSARKPQPQQVYQIDDFIDVCTRPTYSQPVEELVSKYMPSFSSDWAVEVATIELRGPGSNAARMHVPSAEERGARNLMHIHNLLNTN